ncbi:hypothetical protein Tco_1039495 [Tanacetum coccineum]
MYRLNIIIFALTVLVVVGFPSLVASFEGVLVVVHCFFMLTNNGCGGGGCSNLGGGCAKQSGGDGFEGLDGQLSMVLEPHELVLVIQVKMMKRFDKCFYLKWILRVLEVVKEISFLEVEKLGELVLEELVMVMN